MHVLVHPLPVVNRNEPTVNTKDAAGTRPQDNVTSPLYKDDAVEPLPSINTTRTLAGKVCGRLDDVAFNDKVIARTKRAEPVMNVIAMVFLTAGVLLFFVADVTARSALSVVTAATGAAIFMNVAASLSWDMLCLLVRTFEFWFLFFINAANDVLWNMMYHDARIIGFIATGCNFAVSLTFDANIYTRRFVTRVLFLGSPGLLLGVALTALHYPPDLHYKTFHVFGVAVDCVDLLVSGNLIITYFTAIRVFRTQHLVFSQAPIRSIQCDMYTPVCQLVLHSQPLVAEEEDSDAIASAQRLSVLGLSQSLQQLKLLQSSVSHGIDITDVLMPRVACVAARMPVGVLNGLALLSHVVGILGSGRILSGLSDLDDVLPTVWTALVVGSFVSASIFTTIYAANCQRRLMRRIFVELDTWFVSIQITIVTVGVCMLIEWDWRRMAPLFTSWLWCHWMLFLDAVPPPTRRRLGYSRHFARLTTLLLAVYPLALVYALYFSLSGLKEHDRVMVRLSFHGVQWQIKLMGFLASKLFTLEVWMTRFLWRELLRPTDAFKLIKRRVFYRVLSS